MWCGWVQYQGVGLGLGLGLGSGLGLGWMGSIPGIRLPSSETDTLLLTDQGRATGPQNERSGRSGQMQESWG